MNHFNIVFGFIFLSLISLSCQEDFSPKTDFKERYILESYIDLDYDRYMNTQVYATVSRLYNVEGFDPSQNKIDPSVSGAEIYLNYREILYKLQEDTNKTVITKYGTNQIYYYANLQNIYPSYNVSLTAKMPDGKVLTAQTQLLEGIQLGFSYNFDRGFTTKINRFLWGDAFTISWNNINDHLYFPQLLIPYVKLSPSGNEKKYFYEVPYTFIKQNGRYEPVFPSFTLDNSISYDYAAIDSSMVVLLQSGYAKYIFGYIMFQMVEMDNSLSKYYESIHGSLDQYSVNLDESVYSNVKGGLGIFGSRRTLSVSWRFDSTYAKSFIKK
ncbi:MAG: hypothetical protein M1480_11080 [Bacteroidetes bacterium]|nr:hypothetical protein [Bacteroidota bacterium]